MNVEFPVSPTENTRPPPDDGPPVFLVPLRDAAAALGIGYKSARMACISGSLPSAFIAGRWCVPEYALPAPMPALPAGARRFARLKVALKAWKQMCERFPTVPLESDPGCEECEADDASVS